MQKKRGFLQRIGAVGDDDATHIRLRQLITDTLCQRQPDAVMHVLAVNLGQLLAVQCVAAQGIGQAWHRRQQLRHAHLRRGIADVVRRILSRSRNGATRAKNHQFFRYMFRYHLQTFKNWLKIQLLDRKTVLSIHPVVCAPSSLPGVSMLIRPKLTDRQQQILDLIQSAIARTGAPPTRAEIATELGFKSANAAEEHLQALARKGAIELVSGTSRGIRLRSEALRSINESRGKQAPSALAELLQLALPLIGRVAAGSPILAQEHVDRTYYVENSLFQSKPDYLLKVRGMSMRDAGIMDGDLLAVQTTRDAKNGQIVVARLGDEVTVKRFMRNKDVIELHPENPDYQTIVVEPGEPFEIEGLAVGLIRNTMMM
jgi:repressor LexA